jgi:hypothetical protein
LASDTKWYKEGHLIVAIYKSTAIKVFYSIHDLNENGVSDYTDTPFYQ